MDYDRHAQLRTIRPVTPYPGSPLYNANKVLLENYFNHAKDSAIKTAHDLYINKNANFRGFRQI